MVNKNPCSIVEVLRKNFANGITKPLKFRIEQLLALKRMLKENSEKTAKALHDDLRRCGPDADLEGRDISSDVNYMLDHLNHWIKPQYIRVAPKESAYILYEPYGVALIIGTWNFPILAALKPLVGAIAAGNCAVIKPSEVAPATAEFVAEYVPKYLDQDAYRVVLGGVDETTELLEQRFDYIFFIGSQEVGRIVHAAATKFLTPTTLELGGKSPVYLDSCIDVDKAAKKIAVAKTMNAGQVCVAPDYLLCSRTIQNCFIECFKNAIDELFQEEPQLSPLYPRIINDHHFQRVKDFLSTGKIVLGGEYLASGKYIAPTVVIGAVPGDPIMEKEIFGPILPIVNVETVDEAIDFINSKEKPLALYIYSEDEMIIEKILSNTSSGGVCINDCIKQALYKDLPFGGVGNSGMGRYGSKYSFLTFSHTRSVLYNSL